MLQLLFSLGNLNPNALNVLLNLGYPLRTFVLDDLLHSSLLCFHHISYILLCDSFVLDLLEQSVDLSVLGLNFGLRFCDLLSINGLFSNDLLLNVLQFFLANIKPFFYRSFSKFLCFLLCFYYFSVSSSYLFCFCMLLCY